MKKILLGFILPLFILCGCNTGGGNTPGGGDIPPIETKELLRIDLSGNYQREFTVGDTFNHNGLVVHATY